MVRRLSGWCVCRTSRALWLGLLLANLIAGLLRAAPVGADAVVLVNSGSVKYLDFRNFLQPYLDNFGVPYTVLDIATNPVGTNIGHYALILVGHTQLDTNHLYLDATEQSRISQAVSNGTGLVNFDSALSGGGVLTNYSYVQDIFGFSYGAAGTGTSVVLPPTEPGAQMHYITARHTTNETITLRASQTVAGLTLPTNVTAVALSGGKALVAVKQYGAGRAVQWGGYDWVKMSVKGPLGGLDDLVWRGLVWAARKPFVMRGLPNFVTMRIDDVGGPSPANANGLSWAQDAIDAGYKPWLGLFFGCLDATETAQIRNLVTNGQATASIHSWGCLGTSGGRQWFLWNNPGKANWPDAQLTNDFAIGLQWHLTNGIPISKVVAPHYSEMGSNAFAGLKSWGVEYLTIKNYPGTLRDSPWIVGGPYRRYEAQQLGSVLLPLFYADFLTVPGHPEFNGQFFNCVTEIRDDAACGEWCPDTDVAASIGRGTRQVKRALDSLALATLYSHEWYLHPTVDNTGHPAISTASWRAILQGINTNLVSYQPLYVTLDYACQYVRATRTSRLVGGDYDPASGQVTLTFSGKTDLDTTVQIFRTENNSITNLVGPVPMFTNGLTTSVTATNLPPVITTEPSALTVVAGSNATFTVVATGTPPFYYQWQFGGINLAGVTNADYQLIAAQPTNAGSYTVIVSNLASVVTSSNASLTVLVPPAITNQPAGQTVTAGTSVSFTAGASGSEPLFYQWQKDSTNLAGANAATYALINAQPADTGNYSVQVTNAVGLTNSAVAVLTVTNPPPIPPTLAGVARSNVFVLSFSTTPGWSYVVESCDALEAGPWLVLTNVTATETNTDCYDEIKSLRRFYRVRLAWQASDAIQLFGRVQSNQFVLVFNAMTGRSYTIQYAETLASWTPLTNFIAQGTNVTCLDSSTSPLRLYRVITPEH